MPRPTAGLDEARTLQTGLERRVRTEWWLVTGFVLVLTALLSWFSAPLGLTRLDYTFYDETLQVASCAVPDSDIVIIAIDDDSIARLGYWPWRRSVHAQLLTRLETARAVGFDLVLTDVNPAYPYDDSILATAIKQHGRVALPLTIDTGNDTILAPLPVLAAAADATGFINIQPDGDGAIREVALKHGLASMNVQNHFALAMMELGGLETIDVSNKSRLIPYSGAAGNFTVYPYAQVLDGQVSAAAFHKKYVLVGSWATGLGDAFPTPLSPNGDAMPGVEILANILSSALHDRWIAKPAPWVVAMLSCLPVLLACLALGRLSPRRSFVATLAMMCLVFVADGLLLRFGQLWFPPTAALIGVALAYPAWTWRSQEAALQYIDYELRALNSEREQLDHTLTHPGSARAAQTFPARIVQLHTAVEQLRRARQRREETVHFLSHDMRAPQNALLALTQLQRDHASALPQDELLRVVDYHALKTLKLVDGMVLLARAEASAIRFHPTDLVALAQQGCDDFWTQGQAHHISISFEEHPESAWTIGDAELLTRAWCNLLDNAIKYSPGHTAIACRIARENDIWVMTVSDQGFGIEEAQLVQLFQPFVRLPGAERQGGAGLGLALVKTVAQRHGGVVVVSSQRPGGTTFALRLPVVQPPD